MELQTLTQMTLASELAEQGLSHTTIATLLGRHRETIGLWLKGLRLMGWPALTERPRQILVYSLGLGRRHACILIRERLKAFFVMCESVLYE